MTAASPLHGSVERFSSKKLKPKSAVSGNSKTWENKRRLAEKRLMTLACIDNDKNVESDIAMTPLLRSSVGVSKSAVERAEEIQANLSPEWPSFLKIMLKSHVSGGFWLGLPKKFCVAYLPDEDETLVLIDENEEEYNCKYLVEKTGLSGGWRSFSIAHELLDEDVLIFHLIEMCKFKVYIVRARILTSIGVTSLQNLNSPTDAMNEVNSDEDVLIMESPSDECLELVCADKNQEVDTKGLDYLSEAVAFQSEHDSDHSSSDVMDVVKFSVSVLSFNDVKCFKDFHVHFDGLIINAEIPTHLRKKYYELCCCQNSFLHENLVKGLNVKLVAGMICETINIADAIRAAKPSTTTHHLQSWDATLKAFEDLGMMVGFLRARIDKLLNLSHKVQAKIDLKSTEKDEAKKEMRCLKIKLLGVKMRIGNLNDEIDCLKEKKEKISYKFEEIASASW